MESTKGLFTHADVQKIIEKRGMDVSKLPTQAEIERRTDRDTALLLCHENGRRLITGDALIHR